MSHNFKKLLIWQKAMDLSDLIYNYTESLPAKERFNLIEQLNKCSVSIPSNIAEGSGKERRSISLNFWPFLSHLHTRHKRSYLFVKGASMGMKTN